MKKTNKWDVWVVGIRTAGTIVTLLICVQLGGGVGGVLCGEPGVSIGADGLRCAQAEEPLDAEVSD
jgi:hypothetical protein